MFHPRKMKTFFVGNGCPVLEACLIGFGWVGFAVHHWGTSFGRTCVPADHNTICRVQERPANLKSVEWAIRFNNMRWLVLSLSKRCISKATMMKVSSAESPPGFRSPQFDCISQCARSRWALPVLPVCLQVVRPREKYLTVETGLNKINRLTATAGKSFMRGGQGGSC